MFRTFLVALATVAVGLLSGIPSRGVHAVSGGSSVPVSNYEWTVSIHEEQTGRHICGGVLIRSQWILTAAHCLGSYDLYAVLGIANQSVPNRGPNAVEVAQQIPHPTQVDAPFWCLRRLLRSDLCGPDVALLKLATPVAAAPLLDWSEPPRSAPVTVLGWGKGANPAATSLEAVTLSVAGGVRSSAGYFDLRNGARHLCPGDSGGPVIHETTLGPKLVGLVSTSDNLRGTPCGRSSTWFINSARAVKVAPVTDWINDTIAQNGTCIPDLLDPPVDAVLDNGRYDQRDTTVWDFDWTECAGAEAYEILVQHPDAQFPLGGGPVQTSDPSWTYDAVSYTSQTVGWQWRVRAKLDGDWGDWSAWSTFDVEDPDTDPPISGIPLITAFRFYVAFEHDPSFYNPSNDCDRTRPLEYQSNANPLAPGEMVCLDWDLQETEAGRTYDVRREIRRASDGQLVETYEFDFAYTDGTFSNSTPLSTPGDYYFTWWFDEFPIGYGYFTVPAVAP